MKRLAGRCMKVIGDILALSTIQSDSFGIKKSVGAGKEILRTFSAACQNQFSMI